MLNANRRNPKEMFFFSPLFGTENAKIHRESNPINRSRYEIAVAIESRAKRVLTLRCEGTDYTEGSHCGHSVAVQHLYQLA